MQHLLKHNIFNLRKEFSKSKPFRYVLIKNFLPSNFSELILKSLQKEEFKLKESDLFRFKQTDDLKFSRNKTLNSFYTMFSSKEFLGFISDITGKKLSGKIDVAGTLYGNTDYLLPHDDRLEKRKIAYVYYLTKNFSKRDGGELVFYNRVKNDPTKIVKRFIPMWNSIILFEVSQRSFHAVKEVLTKKKRYAIAGWFH